MPGRRSDAIIGGDRAAVTEMLHSRIAGAVTQRSGTSVCVIGPAGMGKSHLVRSVLDALASSDASSAPGGAAALRAVGDHRRRNEPFAVLAQLTGPVPIGEDPAEVAFDRIDERCAAGPLVAWVDDAHNADAASLAGLRRLVWASRSLPLTVVLSARPFPVPEQLELLLRQVDTTVELPPMDPMMTERLVYDRVGRWPGPRLRKVLAGAGGNPLFVNELLLELQADDGLRPVGADTVDIAS
ncbi:MAG TPA: AAA family ATPase, partial [Nakamurella sp.]